MQSVKLAKFQFSKVEKLQSRKVSECQNFKVPKLQSRKVEKLHSAEVAIKNLIYSFNLFLLVTKNHMEILKNHSFSPSGLFLVKSKVHPQIYHSGG